MSNKRNAAVAALNNVKMLHTGVHEPILAELDRAGLLDRPATGGAVQAAKVSKIEAVEAALADPLRSEEVRVAIGDLKRLELALSASGIDVHALNRKMTEAKMSPEQRMRLKGRLYIAGLIDA